MAFSADNFIAFRARRWAANPAQVRIAAIFAARRQAIAIGIAGRALLANRHALLAEILKPEGAGLRRRQAAGGVINVTRETLRTGWQADPPVIIRPITAGNARARPFVALVTIRASLVIITAAQAVFSQIGSLRAIRRTPARFPANSSGLPGNCRDRSCCGQAGIRPDFAGCGDNLAGKTHQPHRS